MPREAGLTSLRANGKILNLMAVTRRLQAYQSMTIKSFHPPLRTLVGPGPSDVHPRILNAMAQPTIGHLDLLFVGMMDEMKSLLQYAFKTENASCSS
jgi:hypothetical protein